MFYVTLKQDATFQWRKRMIYDCCIFSSTVFLYATFCPFVSSRLCFFFVCIQKLKSQNFWWFSKWQKDKSVEMSKKRSPHKSTLKIESGEVNVTLLEWWIFPTFASKKEFGILQYFLSLPLDSLLHLLFCCSTKG